MELLTFHDQFVADLSAYHEYNYFMLLDIIQYPQIARTKLKLCERIWAKALDGRPAPYGSIALI